jgi:hypothetical protein
MKMTLKLSVLLTLLFCGVSLHGCKEEKSGTKKQAANAVPAATQYPAASPLPIDNSTTDEDDEDCKKDSSDDDDEDSDDDDSFDLLSSDEPNWDDDIEEILQDNCLSCHDGSKDGPDLSTYSQAKDEADHIKEQIKSGDMPKEGSLSSSDKNKILDWIEADMPRDAGGSSSSDCGNDGDVDGDEDSDDDDDDDDDNDHDSVSGWEEFLNPPKLKSCKDDGKIFDRIEEECHKAKIAKFDCKRSAIIGAFKDVGVSVATQLDKMDSDGYEIDQCGEYDGDPIVLFYKKETGDDDELKLKIRKICKLNSPACG